MKYRIKSIYFVKAKPITKKLKAKRPITALTVLPPILYKEQTIRIDINSLFALGELPEAKIKKVSPIKKLYKHMRTAAKAIGGQIAAIFLKIKRRLSQRRQKNLRLAFFSGVMTSSATVCIICAAAVLGKLFLPYFKSYTPVTVPMLVGERVESAEALGSEDFELLVTYENSSEIAAGVIMSQRPTAGVTRKIYDRENPCIISVTVSAGKSFYTVENLSGADGRLTLLALYNKGICVRPEYVYSDAVNEGKIIESIPPNGAFLYNGEVLTLKISKGKKKVTVSVPDLYGLSEAQAGALLESRGLVLGNVTYSPSSLGSGKIISQQYSPFSTVSKGSTVNITVSLGQITEQKKVPDLYGLTKEEASAKLSEVGLILGNVTAVTSGAPSGTVITQSVAAGTPITSSITSIDVSISQ